MEWIISGIRDENFIVDQSLRDKVSKILVTYETSTGRRYVKQVECYHGLVSKKLGGKIVAWMPLPEPCKEGRIIYRNGKYFMTAIVE